MKEIFFSQFFVLFNPLTPKDNSGVNARITFFRTTLPA
jgi:hypothetical protein